MKIFFNSKLVKLCFTLELYKTKMYIKVLFHTKSTKLKNKLTISHFF